MKFVAVTLGILFALPAFAAEFDAISDLPPAPPSPGSQLDVPCTSDQGAVLLDAALGLQATTAAYNQGECIPGNPGDPGDLGGFAFALQTCQDGFLTQTSVYFTGSNTQAGDMWHCYVWRDLGGLPADACGMECAVSTFETITGPDVWTTVDWSTQACPCVSFNSEQLWVGTVYELVDLQSPGGPGPDWYVGRDSTPTGIAGTGFGNLSGAHGDWQDLNDFGYGHYWGVENVFDIECGGVPVEPSTWGATKALYR
jgi:hypothetical protein